VPALCSRSANREGREGRANSAVTIALSSCAFPGLCTRACFASRVSQVAVAVERLFPHPKYQKIVRHEKKYLCHDYHEICGVGDRVQIKYVGCLSKRKRWAVVDMVHRFPQVGGEPFPMAKLTKPGAEASSEQQATGASLQ
jgi:small subunit ribosomal protein S17